MPDNYAPFRTAFAHGVASQKYMNPHGETRWSQTASRVARYPLSALPVSGLRKSELYGEIYPLINERRFIPGGRYLYGCGNDYHQVQNCLLLRAEDTREGWARHKYKTMMALMTGAGIGAYYGDIRPAGSPVSRTGGVASGPIPLMKSVNEDGRAAVQGGDRRSAIWAGLLWSHADIFDFIKSKQWPDWLREQKAKDFNTPAPLDMTNISVCLDDDFFACYESYEYGAHLADVIPVPDGSESWHTWAHEVYWRTVESMTTTGEPGFSVDLGDKADEKLRNACTEITSADDSDICNLGGLVLSRFDSPDEFERAIVAGVKYLTAGTLYSDVPYEAVAETRDKNRRLGLDIMGVHEFLLQRGLKYGTDDAFEALEPYMERYDNALGHAWDFQDSICVSRSVAATAGSPTGTRGILGESTTSWEPVTYVSYKRATITSGAALGDTKKYTYVVDPTVKRLVEDGVIGYDSEIEDSASLAYDYERRFKMQAYAQSHTDHAISMTINLPYVMRDRADQKAFGDTLMKYLPELRGITVYPDGAIPGQPIIHVPLEEALAMEGLVVEEDENKCNTGACGI